MMTRQLEVSILSAPLAAIDRRALSQAWYSALHLARDEQLELHWRARNSLGVRVRERAKSELKLSQGEHNGACAGSSVTPESDRFDYATAACTLADRRAPRSPLAKRIEGVLLAHRSRVKRASFTVGCGRVHVVLHTKGDRVALVALCTPALRSVVARALAQARFALAARGVGSQLEAKGAQRCS